MKKKCIQPKNINVYNIKYMLKYYRGKEKKK